MSQAFAFYGDDGLEDNELYLQLEKAIPASEAIQHVPTYNFAIHRKCDDAKIGTISLKVGYNENIFYVGNVGYEIYPQYQGNHYAQKACHILFPLAIRHQMETLIITCDPDNIPSNRICVALGAKLLETVDVPMETEAYALGAKRKCRYTLAL